MLDTDHRLIKNLPSLLQELSNTVKVSGKEQARRIGTLSILSFRFSKELFQPFSKVPQISFEIFEDLQGFPLLL